MAKTNTKNRPGSGTIETLREEVGRQVSPLPKDFLKQLLGFGGKSPVHADRAPEEQAAPQAAEPGIIEVFSLAKIKPSEMMPKQVHADRKQQRESPAQAEHRRGAINYHEQFQNEVLDSGHRFSQREKQQMNQRVVEIMAELRKLVQSSKMLQMEFTEITTEQAPLNAGEYHTNFFEWMLIVIRQARQKVEDSGAWLNSIKGKGAKKQSGYWGMFKKHGTSFGMSNERAVATQTG